jgi:hypothetical protein
MYVNIEEWKEKQELIRKFEKKEISEDKYKSEIEGLDKIIREKLDQINQENSEMLRNEQVTVTKEVKLNTKGMKKTTYIKQELNNGRKDYNKIAEECGASIATVRTQKSRIKNEN